MHSTSTAGAPRQTNDALQMSGRGESSHTFDPAAAQERQLYHNVTACVAAFRRRQYRACCAVKVKSSHKVDLPEGRSDATVRITWESDFTL